MFYLTLLKFLNVLYATIEVVIERLFNGYFLKHYSLNYILLFALSFDLIVYFYNLLDLSMLY